MAEEKQIEVSYSSAPLNKKKTAILVSTLENLYQKHKVIKAQDFLAEAAKANHPLHGEFEWDDKKAGKLFRLNQARQLIASVRIRIVDENATFEPIRAFVNLRPEADDSLGLPERGYAPTILAMQSLNHKQQILAYAHGQLLSWKKRFGALKEFSQIVQVIEQVKI